MGSMREGPEGSGQPPLSLQIKDLEREVGAQLFRCSVHRAELTAPPTTLPAALRRQTAQVALDAFTLRTITVPVRGLNSRECRRRR